MIYKFLDEVLNIVLENKVCESRVDYFFSIRNTYISDMYYIVKSFNKC